MVGQGAGLQASLTDTIFPWQRSQRSRDGAMVPRRLAMRHTRGKSLDNNSLTRCQSHSQGIAMKHCQKRPGVLEHGAYIVRGKSRLHSVITEDPFIGSIEKPR